MGLMTRHDYHEWDGRAPSKERARHAGKASSASAGTWEHGWHLDSHSPHHRKGREPPNCPQQCDLTPSEAQGAAAPAVRAALCLFSPTGRPWEPVCATSCRGHLSGGSCGNDVSMAGGRQDT